MRMNEGYFIWNQESKLWLKKIDWKRVIMSFSRNKDLELWRVLCRDEKKFKIALALNSTAFQVYKNMDLTHLI